MRKLVTLSLCLLLLVSLANAQKRRSKPKPKPEDHLNAGIVRTPNLAALEKKVSDLEGRIVQLSIRSTKYDAAELNISRDAYQRVDDSTGTSFLVRLVRAESYLNGYKITVAIGNITTATFNGCDLTVRWGTREPKGIDEWIAWRKTVRTKDEHVTEDLNPGRWNEVEMIILPAKADELSFLELSIRTSTLSLRK